jgi:hypothetical protein
MLLALTDHLEGPADQPSAEIFALIRQADALDAVLAALAPAFRWPRYDHRAIAKHPRYKLEGHVYT